MNHIINLSFYDIFFLTIDFLYTIMMLNSTEKGNIYETEKNNLPA